MTTASASGTTGTWLIDPADFTIGAGGNISGATLSAQLVTNNVLISTMPVPGQVDPGENGDIIVNDAVAWTASGTPTTLTLHAFRDVNINAPITATNGNLVVCCGRDVNVTAPITTTNGSVLLNAGRDVRVFHSITTTDGNIALCARDMTCTCRSDADPWLDHSRSEPWPSGRPDLDRRSGRDGSRS